MTNKETREKRKKQTHKFNRNEEYVWDMTL